MPPLSCLMVDSPGVLDRTGPRSYLVGTFGIGGVYLRFIKTENRHCGSSKIFSRTDLAEIRRDVFDSVRLALNRIQYVYKHSQFQNFLAIIIGSV
jgi:hypothetical protein